MNKAQIIAKTTLFERLATADYALIADLTSEVFALKGEYVYHQGQLAHSLYIIVSGAVELEVEAEGGYKAVVGCLGAGEHFGELSLLTGSPRSLSIRAQEDLVLLTLDKLLFDQILIDHPRIHRVLDQVLANRLRQASLDQVNQASAGHDALPDTTEVQAQKIELEFLRQMGRLSFANIAYRKIKQDLLKLIYKYYEADLCTLYSWHDGRLQLEQSHGDPRLENYQEQDLCSESFVVGQVHLTGQPLLINDLSSADAWADCTAPVLADYSSVLAVPIGAGDDYWGVLCLRHRELDFFPVGQLDFWQSIAPQIGALLHKSRRDQQVRRRQEELNALCRIGQELNASYDLPRLLYKIVSLTANLMGTSGVILRLYDDDTQLLRIKSYYGIPASVAESATQKAGEGIAGWVIKEGRPLISNNAQEDERFAYNIPVRIKSVLCVPLLMKGNIIGTMSVYDKMDGDQVTGFDEDDQRLMETVASQASIAIENARVFTSQTSGQTGAIQLSQVSEFVGKSRIARVIQQHIHEFSTDLHPLLLGGEPGTARRQMAKQIHLQSPYREGPYIEVDVRRLEKKLWGSALFGHAKGAFPLSPVQRLGVLEQFKGGTVVLTHVEAMDQLVQVKLLEAIQNACFVRVGGQDKIVLTARIILICNGKPEDVLGQEQFNNQLLAVVKDHTFVLPPLRAHKKDIPLLVEKYLDRYSKEHGKQVGKINPEALGLLLNYDWPGNLNEFRNVLQRAVILAEDREVLSEQILLGLPRTEGGEEFNLLRIDAVRRTVISSLFPVVIKAVIAVLFFFALVAIIWGPAAPEENVGMTINWIYGWPLLTFSFFFMARFWCAICALSMPGMLAQRVWHMEKKVPRIITENSGTIMTTLGLLILWVEVVFGAMHNRQLTAGIIILISSGSLIFSIIYERNAWCRYICPLGAINAIFSMTSILELRANRHMCTNNCRTYSCYKGSGKYSGCPMYRHPYMIDNNRDCTLCGNCIKNCQLRSIQLNTRMRASELWEMKRPRLADSVLIVGLCAIVLFFAREASIALFSAQIGLQIGLPGWVVESVLFWAAIGSLWVVFCALAARFSNKKSQSPKELSAALGYGLLPLALGGFLAFYLEIFVAGAWRIVPNMVQLFGGTYPMEPVRLLSVGGTATWQSLFILSGACAALYSTKKIGSVRFGVETLELSAHGGPFALILGLGIAYMQLI